MISTAVCTVQRAIIMGEFMQAQLPPNFMQAVSYKKYKENGREENCDIIWATSIYSIKAVSVPASPLLNLKSQNASEKHKRFLLNDWAFHLFLSRWFLTLMHYSKRSSSLLILISAVNMKPVIEGSSGNILCLSHISHPWVNKKPGWQIDAGESKWT